MCRREKGRMVSIRGCGKCWGRCSSGIESRELTHCCCGWGHRRYRQRLITTAEFSMRSVWLKSRRGLFMWWRWGGCSFWGRRWCFVVSRGWVIGAIKALQNKWQSSSWVEWPQKEAATPSGLLQLHYWSLLRPFRDVLGGCSYNAHNYKSLEAIIVALLCYCLFYE